MSELEFENRFRPAFPCADQEGQCHIGYEGLTKREYFAVNAPDVPDWFLPADQMNAWHEDDTKRKAEIFFEWRVFYANKMLSALENQNDPT